jgi:hypothetical protein
MNKKLAIGIQVALGFLLGVVLNIVVVWAGSLASSLLPPIRLDISLYGLIFIGATQLIWQLPMILILRRKHHKGLALGVILAVSITALLNATCWGLMMAGKIRIGG